VIAIVAAAILALCSHVESDRADAIAADIVAVSEREAFFEGDAGPLATALLLVALGRVESDFHERIERCECRRGECDNGRSLGIWQIMRGDPAMCGDRQAQALAALSVLQEARRMCKDVPRTLGAYNSGRCRKTKASRYVYATWQRLLRESGIVMRGERAVWIRGET